MITDCFHLASTQRLRPDHDAVEGGAYAYLVNKQFGEELHLGNILLWEGQAAFAGRLIQNQQAELTRIKHSIDFQGVIFRVCLRPGDAADDHVWFGDFVTQWISFARSC